MRPAKIFFQLKLEKVLNVNILYSLFQLLEV